MDDSAAESSPRSQLLADLSDELDMPVIAVASGWCGNNVVNLGEEGARAFLEVLDAELAGVRREKEDAPGSDESESTAAVSMGLFLVGRGGFASFADGVWRALKGRGVQVHAIVPHRVDGASSLLALSSHHRWMHPFGALGAFDRRPLGRLKAKIDADMVRGLTSLGELDLTEYDLSESDLAELACQRRHAQLSRQMMRRMLGGSESGLGARIERRLCAEVLGDELALSGVELDELGLETTIVEGRSAELTWQLYRAYERELEVLEVAAPRYTQSQVADEVEFAPATGLTGAIIEGINEQLVFELDTGSPDPDTGMLDGEWSWHQEELELMDL